MRHKRRTKQSKIPYIPITILEKHAGIYREAYKANILIYGKDYVAGSVACEYVSPCTKVPAVARGLHVCHERRMTEKRFLGKVPGDENVPEVLCTAMRLQTERM